MDTIATILSWIGFIVLVATVVGLGMIVFLCLSIRKCDREEERAVMQEIRLKERGALYPAPLKTSEDDFAIFAWADGSTERIPLKSTPAYDDTKEYGPDGPGGGA